MSPIKGLWRGCVNSAAEGVVPLFIKNGAKPQFMKSGLVGAADFGMDGLFLFLGWWGRKCFARIKI
jgi:hypothetical protein